jgi:hypothetical protein
MGQTLIKECQECGLGYYKPWYEPMWLGRKNWIEAHKAYHNYSQRDYGRDLERERIIKLIEPLGCPANGHNCENNLALYTADDLIALIKGNK